MRLENEREDWQAVRDSDVTLKTSLMNRLEELEQVQTRLRADLAIKGARVDEVEKEQAEQLREMEKERISVTEFKGRIGSELTEIKRNEASLRKQNK